MEDPTTNTQATAVGLARKEDTATNNGKDVAASKENDMSEITGLERIWVDPLVNGLLGDVIGCMSLSRSLEKDKVHVRCNGICCVRRAI